jgi:spore coat polysaccharide biosynthesis protein SpsF
MERHSALASLAIIQARMSSTRLPGKVLKDIAGQSMLARVVLRTRRAHSVSQVVVATTTDPADDAIFDYCRTHGFPVFRGSQFDVLDRYYQAARLYQAEVLVRLTADCPLMDPAEIDHVVAEFERAGVDFAANRLPPPWKRTYPIGLDIEVCTFAALERAWQEAKQPYEREHVMPYLYDEESRFKILVVDHDPDYGDLRWTVDTPEDLVAVRRIYAAFDGDDGFSWLEVLDLYSRYPELKSINQSIAAKTLTKVDHRLENQK